MQFVKFSCLLSLLAATTVAASAQNAIPSHSYTSVDPFGNVTRTTVQTPLAAASSVAGLIAGQGVLGANTTSSTSITYGNAYGNISSSYCVPNVPYYPVPYPSGYGYPAPTVNNNYYYPAQPYSGPIGPVTGWLPPPWITSIPLSSGYGYNNSYGGPATPYAAPYPAYGGTYYGGGYGSGYGSIENRSQNSGFSVSIGSGGLSGHYGNHHSGHTTIVTR